MYIVYPPLFESPGINWKPSIGRNMMTTGFKENNYFGLNCFKNRAE